MSDHIASFKAKSEIVAMRVVEEGDKEDHGVKGQRWGVRRSSSALRAAAKTRGPAPAKKESTDEKAPASSGSSVKKPAGDIQNHVESSSDRYARLESQAKAGKASDMTEQDLKFFNARTEALAKINKMNEEKPSWLRETSVKVIQQSAQRQMQTVADSLADKYIGDPIKTAIKGKKD